MCEYIAKCWKKSVLHNPSSLNSWGKSDKENLSTGLYCMYLSISDQLVLAVGLGQTTPAVAPVGGCVGGWVCLYWRPRNGWWSNSSDQKSQSDLEERKSIMAPSKHNDFFWPSSWFSATWKDTHEHALSHSDTADGPIRPLCRPWCPHLTQPFRPSISAVTMEALVV